MIIQKSLYKIANLLKKSYTLKSKENQIILELLTKKFKEEFNLPEFLLTSDLHIFDYEWRKTQDERLQKLFNYIEENYKSNKLIDHKENSLVISIYKINDAPIILIEEVKEHTDSKVNNFKAILTLEIKDRPSLPEDNNYFKMYRNAEKVYTSIKGRI